MTLCDSKEEIAALYHGKKKINFSKLPNKFPCFAELVSTEFELHNGLFVFVVCFPPEGVCLDSFGKALIAKKEVKRVF